FKPPKNQFPTHRLKIETRLKGRKWGRTKKFLGGCATVTIVVTRFYLFLINLYSFKIPIITKCEITNIPP
ncbi:MAG: hypothetical protein AAF688_09515, partial [Bacteroidota bacterium]